jgi:hypothetical protein
MYLLIPFYSIPLAPLVTMLAAATLAAYYVGLSSKRWIYRNNPEKGEFNIGPIETALLGLLSLLLSFSFSMSANRYDGRRALVVKEANDIGTVLKRAALYTPKQEAEIKDMLLPYVKSRIEYYNASDEPVLQQLRAKADSISSAIWLKVSLIEKSTAQIGRDTYMVPAVNDMMDDVASRDALRLAIVPNLIIYLLIALTLCGGFVLGFTQLNNKHNSIVLGLYIIMTTLTIFTILDLDRPKSGFIQTATTHQKIEELIPLLK